MVKEYKNKADSNNVFAEKLEASGGSNQGELVSNLHHSNELIFEEVDDDN